MKVLVLNNFAIGKTHLGKSVFAARPFKKGDVITQFTGRVVHKSKLPKSYKGVNDRYVQVTPDSFMGPSGEIDDLINHSCEPNAGLKFKKSDILLVALKRIKIGEEITWDYSTTLFEDAWKLKCDCRKRSCRGIIGDFALLDKNLQKKYQRLDIIPQYLHEYMNSAERKIYTKGLKHLKRK